MKKPFGQNFLFDTNLLKKIIRCSGLRGDETALEIGPGLGPLTRLLADSAKEVIAIEFDKKLITKLKENLSDKDNVRIVTGDALKFPFEKIKGSFRVIANIPYNITTPLIFKLLEHKEKIISMTLLVQKEVANRIVAVPGTREYGVLSISIRLYTKPSLKFVVSRKAFSPPPRVDSAVVHLDVSPSALIDVKDEALFMAVVRSAFSRRRKTIINALKSFQGIGAALDKAGINPGLRPQELGIEDFRKLSSTLEGIKPGGKSPDA